MTCSQANKVRGNKHRHTNVMPVDHVSLMCA